MKTVKLYKPDNFPWRAKRTQVENYVWYCILDSYGNELFTTERMPANEDQQLMSEVALVLSTVNKSDVFTIDGKQFNIIWSCDEHRERVAREKAEAVVADAPTQTHSAAAERSKIGFTVP